MAGSMLWSILYWNTESFVLDVTDNGIKYGCGRSITLKPALSTLIWDVGGSISFGY